MKMKKAAVLLAACALSVFAVHAGAATINSSDFKDGEILKLSENSDFTETISIDSKSVTLDLNGNTLSNANSAVIKLINNAALTVTDSSEAANGQIIFTGLKAENDEHGYYSYISANNSSFVFNKGMIKAEGDVPSGGNTGSVIVLASDNSTVTVEGGSAYISSDYLNGYAVYNNSVMNFNGGYIGFDEDYVTAAFAISCYGNGNEVNINNGEIKALAGVTLGKNNSLNVNGGSITANYTGVMSQGGTIKINGGTITSEDSGIYGDSGSMVEIGGDAVLDAPVVVSFWNMKNFTNVLRITGGTITGDVVDGSQSSDLKGDISITGGAFEYEPPAEYIADGFKFVDGSVVEDKQTNVTVATENVSQATVNGTAATGFVTTIKTEDELVLKTISWNVTHAGVSADTGVFNLSGTVTLGGDATIGLVVDGFDDADAVAAATVNGYLKED